MEADSIGSLTDAVTSLIRETHLRWWFRGHSSTSQVLLPGVRRNYGPGQEQHLSNEFYARARTRHGNCPGPEDYAGWLSLMQHYGLPTRLLDWSMSPIVAAFFAVDGHTDSKTDACIWALSPGSLNESQGVEPLLYPLDNEWLRPHLWPALKGSDVPEEDKAFAAMAIESDMRMQMQQGAFTIHTSSTPLDEFPNSSAWLRKITIPARAVRQIKFELATLGIRLDYLFPDLGHLAIELKRFHAPRGSAV